MTYTSLTTTLSQDSLLMLSTLLMKCLFVLTGLPVSVPYRLDELFAQLEAKMRPTVAEAAREQGCADAPFIKKNW